MPQLPKGWAKVEEPAPLPAGWARVATPDQAITARVAAQKARLLPRIPSTPAPPAPPAKPGILDTMAASLAFQTSPEVQRAEGQAAADVAYGYVQHGPGAVVAGVRDIARGNVARGGRQV